MAKPITPCSTGQHKGPIKPKTSLHGTVYVCYACGRTVPYKDRSRS